MSDYVPVYLKKNEDKRIKAGHLWVFSNEIDTNRSVLKDYTPGQAVELFTAQNKSLGTGYINPNSLISIRLVSRDRQYPLTASLIVHRLKVALSLRERLYDQPYYRLVYGESDSLPGLVVDRYADVITVQIATAGMECLKQEIIDAIDKVLRPSVIVLKNDAEIRQREDLPLYVETVKGETPERVRIVENEIQYDIDVLQGQKTGWFYDHRENRQQLQRFCKDQRVLDVFSYVGGWGLNAACHHAKEVDFIDSSHAALDLAEANATLNNVAEKCRFIEADAFDALKSFRAEREKYDVVIVDPPAFIKRKKDSKEGLAAYHRLNKMAMQVLAKDGILVSASCSYHLQKSQLQSLLLQNARNLDKDMQIIMQGQQAPDHPVHPAIQETQYIKAFFCRLIGK